MKKIIFIGIAVCSLLFTGCSLDKTYLNGPSTGTFPADEKDAMSGLLAAYKNLSTMDASSTPFPGIEDNCSDIGASRNFNASYTYQIQSQFSSQSALAEKLYTQIYKGAARVHLVLDNLDKIRHTMSDESYYQIKAELLLVRDYYYDLGCQMYGDIPFIDHCLSLAEARNFRTPRAEVTDRILNEDLTDELLDHLPIRYSKSDYGTGRLGRVGAYGLKARIALNWGKYDMAAQYAHKALELAKGVYALAEYDKSYCGKDHTAGEPSVANLFGPTGKDNDEMIWALQYSHTISGNSHNGGYYATSRTVGGCSYFGPTQNLMDAFQCTDGKSIVESPIYDYKNPWENRDPRMDLFCVRPGTRAMGVEFQTDPAKTTVRNYNTGKNIVNIDVTGTKSEYGPNGNMGPAGYLWRKYLDNSEFTHNSGAFSTSSACVLNYPLMRLAELYLIEAEANIEMDGGDLNLAKDAINTIRLRAGMPNVTTLDKAELRKALRYERMVELCNEGFRWFDIRRWKIAEKVVSGPLYAPAYNGALPNAKPTFDANWHPVYDGATFDGKPMNLRVFTSMTFNPLKDFLWPIPEVERFANPNLVQNPYY